MSETYLGVIFAKVDVDSAPDVAAHLKVEAMPTFVLLRDGEVYYQFQGFRESALHDILSKSGAQPSEKEEQACERSCLIRNSEHV
jgi:thioredoxin-like negative regulator of GroEL